MRRLHMRYYPDGGGADFNDAIALFAGLGSVLHACFGVQGPQELLSGALLKLFRAPGPTVWSALLFVLLVHCFWMLGIHGSMLLEPVARGIFVPALAANQQLAAAHLPPASIFTKTFFDTFVLMGGCGSTLCLVIAIFAEYVEAEAQRDQLKRLGCCQYQGYLYCRALPSAELAEFIETW